MHPTLERLFAALSEIKPVVGPSDVARRLDMTPQRVSAGRTRGVSKEGMLVAATKYGVQARYVVSGKGPKVVASPYPRANVEAGPALIGEPVPIIDYVDAGKWSPAAPQGFADATEVVYSSRPHSRYTYALRVRGDSMTAPYGVGKSYPAASIIIVDPERRSPVSGQKIVAKLDGDGEDAVVFKVFVQESGRTFLRPINPQHPTIYDAFSVLGTVIQKIEDE